MGFLRMTGKGKEDIPVYCIEMKEEEDYDQKEAIMENYRWQALVNTKKK